MSTMALPKRFSELAEAFNDPNYPGWSIGSAEAGWVTPSEKEWGRPPQATDTTQATEALQTATS
jgi:hypothetical protein